MREIIFGVIFYAVGAAAKEGSVFQELKASQRYFRYGAMRFGVSGPVHNLDHKSIQALYPYL